MSKAWTSRTSAPTATRPRAERCPRCLAPHGDEIPARHALKGTMSTPVFDPPALESGALRVTPLGGLGEVGRNMAMYEFDGKILLVDCGVLFPEEHQPGVDLILPDMEPLKDRLGDIVGLVLTHGHEDHIGG